MAVTKERMITAIQDLPDDASVEDAIERLLRLRTLDRGAPSAGEDDESPPSARIQPGFGGAKGLIEISDDFDAPIDDFEDYR